MLSFLKRSRGLRSLRSISVSSFHTRSKVCGLGAGFGSSYPRISPAHTKSIRVGNEVYNPKAYRKISIEESFMGYYVCLGYYDSNRVDTISCDTKEDAEKILEKFRDGLEEE